MGHPDLAIESYDKALVVRERLAGENPSVSDFQNDLAETHHNMGLAYRLTGHLDRAKESYGKALQNLEHLVREHGDVEQYQSSLAKTHQGIGDVERAWAILTSH